MTKDNQIEIEATLLVLSEQPEALVTEMAALDSLAGYRLVPQRNLHILDTYFDTPDGQIHSKKLGLRIRQSVFRRLITLKGHPSITSSGAIERLEMEAAFSEEAMNSVAVELARFGVQLTEPVFDADNPMSSMESLGLEAVQTRKNNRIVRQVVGTQSNKPSAELVIDSVEYLLGDISVRHYEVEVESKGQSGEDSIRDLIGGLEQKYRPALRLWSHDKLVIGKALEEILAGDEDPEKLMDSRGNLRPETYQMIDAYITNNLG